MKIGILTGGGDCPALNAVIRAAVKTSVGYGWDVAGIEEGFDGLIHSRLRPMSTASVSGILHLGGTILGTTNAANPFTYPVVENGKTVERDISDQVVENFRRLGLDALIVISGDGTLGIAQRFFEKGVPLVGVPKTIDNDIGGTVITFGFDTAVNTGRDALDKLHTTAESHRRVLVVEVMGRHAGWIAVHTGIAGGADVILIPEIPYRVEAIVEKIKTRGTRKRSFSIVAISEGAYARGGNVSVVAEANEVPGRGVVRLGGSGRVLADALAVKK